MYRKFLAWADRQDIGPHGGGLVILVVLVLLVVSWGLIWLGL